MKKNLTLIFSAFILSCTTYAQDFNAIVGDHLSKTSQTDFEIVQNNFNPKTQANQLHVQRKYQGLPVYASYANYVIKNNQIQSIAKSENFDLKLANVAVTPTLTIDDVLGKLGQAEQLHVSKTTSTDLNTTAPKIYYFEDQPAQLTYYIDEDQQAHLAYAFTAKISKDRQNEIFDIVTDALTGEILEKHTQTLSCGFDHQSFSNENLAHFNREEWNWLYDAYDATSTTTNGYYSVLKLPLEAPNFGTRSVYNTGAFNPEASPLGWHKINPTENDLTITRGNNTRTVHDNESVGYDTYNGANAITEGYVDGGTSMVFDFPYDQSRHPYFYNQASATNLFYMNNMMHDIYYRYGFTEQYGNFQENNFEKGGTGNDPVIALAQTGLAVGESNNATFSTPIDGRSPLMSMYLWDAPSTFTGKPLTINTPSSIAGDYAGLKGNFGPDLPLTPITSDFVLLTKSESTGTPYDGCGTLTNAEQIAGKIAVVLRGDCTFVDKVQNAQNAGAIAVIVANNTSGEINMGGDSTTITIPSISVNSTIGNSMITKLAANEVVNGTLKYVEIPYIDGSFDNGIIAHEYGHGISTRQTGPVSNSSCLNNVEQMGEGWSDFFGLMITQLPTDTAAQRRGIGTFAVNQASTGVGIRPTPYSTNMVINPSTYRNLANYGNTDSPHRTGYVWATMLWDLNWKMIDKYGFTPDLIYGQAGNTMTIDLVMEGLRLQPCRPGFVDGRNAILQADELLNEGQNKCDIWSVFARRGLGYSASQGSSTSRTDGTAAFDMPPADVLNCELGSTELSTSESFKLFPNPAKDLVYVYDESLKGEVNVEIIDMVGRVISTETIVMQNNKNAINTAHLPKGVYVIKFNTANSTISKKLIKK